MEVQLDIREIYDLFQSIRSNSHLRHGINGFPSAIMHSRPDVKPTRQEKKQLEGAYAPNYNVVSVFNDEQRKYAALSVDRFYNLIDPKSRMKNEVMSKLQRGVSMLNAFLDVIQDSLVRFSFVQRPLMPALEAVILAGGSLGILSAYQINAEQLNLRHSGQQFVPEFGMFANPHRDLSSSYRFDNERICAAPKLGFNLARALFEIGESQINSGDYSRLPLLSDQEAYNYINDLDKYASDLSLRALKESEL